MKSIINKAVLVSSFSTFLALMFAPVNASAPTNANTTTNINTPDTVVDCVISPSKIVEVSAPVAGVVGQVHVDLGDSVSRGDLVAALDSRVEQAGLALAQKRLDMSAEVAAEQANLKFSRLQRNRVTQLGGDKLISEQEQDEAERSENVSYWRIEQLKHTEQIRYMELSQAKAQLEQKQIRSTIDGVVSARYKHEGEYVEDQPILQVVNLDTLHVDAVLPMSLFPKIKAGMTATVHPEIDEQSSYQAVVDAVDPIGDVASGTFGVRLVMDNQQKLLPAGIKCYLQLDQTLDSSWVASTP